MDSIPPARAPSQAPEGKDWPAMLSVRQAVDYLRERDLYSSKSTIGLAIKQGQFPAQRLGRRILIPREALDAWIRGGLAQPTGIADGTVGDTSGDDLLQALRALRGLAIELVRVAAGDYQAIAAARIIDGTAEGRRYFAQAAKVAPDPTPEPIPLYPGAVPLGFQPTLQQQQRRRAR